MCNSIASCACLRPVMPSACQGSMLGKLFLGALACLCMCLAPTPVLSTQAPRAPSPSLLTVNEIRALTAFNSFHAKYYDAAGQYLWNVYPGTHKHDDYVRSCACLRHACGVFFRSVPVALPASSFVLCSSGCLSLTRARSLPRILRLLTSGALLGSGSWPRVSTRFWTTLPWPPRFKPD